MPGYKVPFYDYKNFVYYMSIVKLVKIMLDC